MSTRLQSTVAETADFRLFNIVDKSPPVMFYVKCTEPIVLGRGAFPDVYQEYVRTGMT